MRPRPIGAAETYLHHVLTGQNWSATAGSWTSALEAKFCEQLNTKYAIATNSGTSALHAALEAVGVQQGDEVISPALTVIMDTFAILHAQAVPIYADVDPLTFNVTADTIAAKITSKTTAIIVVSLYGLTPELGKIKVLADQYSIPLILDNCQGMLNHYDGTPVGNYCDIVCYSFEDSKIISCGEGGMLTTNDEVLAQRARKLAGIGFKNLTAKEGRVKLNSDVFQNPSYERHDTLGYNYRLSEILSAVALAQFEMVDQLCWHRAEVACKFIDLVNSLKAERTLTPQLVPFEASHSYWTLAFSYHGHELWQDFRKRYISNGGDGIYGAWQVPYLEPVIKDKHFLNKCDWVPKKVIDNYTGSCPTAESLQRTIMQFKTNYFDDQSLNAQLQALKATLQ